jgi:hypothetical protein
MSDKAKAAKPGEGMTREQLVRAHFDAYRDLIWKEDLEPKFLRYDLGADDMRRYRQEWNAYTEKRDWAWWVQNAAQVSNDELRADIAECHEKIEAIDERRLPPELRKRVQSAFQEILNGDSLGNDRSPDLTLARTKTREM